MKSIIFLLGFIFCHVASAQVLNYGGIGNASQFQGRNVSTIAPANNQVLIWNASTQAWTPGSAGGSGGIGTVTSVGSGVGLLGGPITTAGTLRVDVGTTANKIVQLTPTAQYPAVDGFLITNLNAANRFLSNLISPTAINKDFLPGITNTVNIGDSAAYFATSSILDMSTNDVDFYTTLASQDNAHYTGSIFVNANESTSVGTTSADLILVSGGLGGSGLGTNATGVYVATPATTAAGANTQNILIATGNATGTAVANSGDITLAVGNATSTRGLIKLVDASLGGSSNGYLWTLTNNNTGAGAWANLDTSGFANISLSNLHNPTTVNAGLVPLGDATYPLGSSVNRWTRLYLSDSVYNGSNIQIVNIGNLSLNDSSGHTSIDFGGRLLEYSGTGNKSALDWSTVNTIYLPSNSSTNTSLLFRDNSNTPGTEVGFVAPATIITPVTWKLPPSDGSGGQFLRTNGSGFLSWNSTTSSQWVTTGSDIYYNAGKVGIGTMTPVSLLSPIGTPATTKNYGLVSIGDGAFDGVTIGTFSGSTHGTYIAVSAAPASLANLIDLQQGGLSYLDVTAAGFVGIAEQAPANLLDVNGTVVVGSYAGSVGPSNGLAVSGNVGIGTISPNFPLQVSTNVSNVQKFLTGTIVDVAGTDSAAARIMIDSFSGAAVFDGRRADGTAAAPSGLLANDIISHHGALGYGSTSYGSGSAAGFDIYASENWNDSAHGTYLALRNTTNGTTVLSEKMRIDNAGNVGIGTGTPVAILDIHGSSGSTLKIVDGNQGANKLLESNSTGQSSWISLIQGTGMLISYGTGNITLAATGNVGIGTVSANYVVSATDTVLYTDSTNGVFNITLPAPSAGRVIEIKDSTGTAATNNITIVRNGSEKIEGVAASYIFQIAWLSKRLVSNGTDWFFQ